FLFEPEVDQSRHARLGLAALGRPHGADEDVARPELLDLLQRLALRPLADRDHDDHRGHAEDDAQRGEQAAQLVKAQVLQPQEERLGEEAEHRCSSVVRRTPSVDNRRPATDNEPPMEQTLFTQIIARQVPAKIAYEDERYIAIHDVSPQAATHLLWLPTRVIPTLNDLSSSVADLVGGMFLVARKLMESMGH